MSQQNTIKGVLCALGAYLIWGVAPIYFKTIQDGAGRRDTDSSYYLVIFLYVGFINCNKTLELYAPSVKAA